MKPDRKATGQFSAVDDGNSSVTAAGARLVVLGNYPSKFQDDLSNTYFAIMYALVIARRRALSAPTSSVAAMPAPILAHPVEFHMQKQNNKKLALFP
uniref:Uncharacterized protein n=1 Tax=Romanomermis culicivorax TaxID=13658 RepID=A0A915IEN5_ROMCU